MVLLLTAILVTAARYKLIYERPVCQVLCHDIDGNGINEKYVLNKQRLKVWEDSHLIWQTPQEWQVKQIILADADNNEQKELSLVVWKKGSYGKSKPFWFKGPDDQYSCHLFIYRLLSGRMKAVWCSSALEHPIIHLDVLDRDDDGLKELIVTEGPRYGFAYALRQHINRHDTSWVWNGWGFERID